MIFNWKNPFLCQKYKSNKSLIFENLFKKNLIFNELSDIFSSTYVAASIRDYGLACMALQIGAVKIWFVIKRLYIYNNNTLE